MDEDYATTSSILITQISKETLLFVNLCIILGKKISINTPAYEELLKYSLIVDETGEPYDRGILHKVITMELQRRNKEE